MIKRKDMDYIIIKMVNYIKENGKMIKEMEKEYYIMIKIKKK